jgi:twitching motility protein PilJ
MAFNIKDLPAKIKDFFSGKANSGASKGASYRQTIIPIIGLLIFIALAFYAISQVRVNGPVYNKIQTNYELRADILPPPLYAVDAFAAANAAYVATANSDTVLRDKKLAEVKKAEVEYKNRLAYWQNTGYSFSMQGHFQAVVKSNENFCPCYSIGGYCSR